MSEHAPMPGNSSSCFQILDLDALETWQIWEQTNMAFISLNMDP